MKTKAMYRVVAIAVFYVATYRMSHIGRVYTNLVFPPCLQFVFHKTMLRGAVEHPVMGDGIFSSESSIYTYIIVQRSSKLKIYFVVNLSFLSLTYDFGHDIISLKIWRLEF